MASVSELLPAVGSSVEVLDEAVLERSASEVEVTTIEKVAVAPEAIVPRVAGDGGRSRARPWLGEAETKVTVAGRLSASVTPGRSGRRW